MERAHECYLFEGFRLLLMSLGQRNFCFSAACVIEQSRYRIHSTEYMVNDRVVNLYYFRSMSRSQVVSYMDEIASLFDFALKLC